MSASGMVPCWQCGADMPIEHSRCSRCGTPRRATSLADLETMPGAPLVRPPKRRRISSHDLVPWSLRQEYEQVRRERAARGAASEASRRSKFFWAAGTGAALTAFPMAIPAFLFLPKATDALVLSVLDFFVGALAGLFTLRVGGGLFRGLVTFSIGFCFSVWFKLKLGYPIEHQPVAFAVLASAAALSLLVACVVGVALDEHVDTL